MINSIFNKNDQKHVGSDDFFLIGATIDTKVENLWLN